MRTYTLGGETCADPLRAQLFWLYPLAAAATYYSGLLRASEETDKRSSRSSANSDNRGLAVKIVSEVRTVSRGSLSCPEQG